MTLMVGFTSIACLLPTSMKHGGYAYSLRDARGRPVRSHDGHNSSGERSSSGTRSANSHAVHSMDNT